MIAKHCMQQGDVFITMRSGQRMIAFSLTYDEFDAIADVVDALAEAGEDSKDT